jgi:hypothetical protein
VVGVWLMERCKGWCRMRSFECEKLPCDLRFVWFAKLRSIVLACESGL